MREALERWCDPALVERVKAIERTYTEYELDQTHRVQLTPRTERRQPRSGDWKIDRDDSSWLAAWRDLERDLRRRIELGEIHLFGVQMKPERRMQAEPIPGGWAASFKFDFGAGTIAVDECRYTAIICSREPSSASSSDALPPSQPAQNSVPTKLGAEDMAVLDDETILALLEEHHRRVVEGPDAKSA